jgi:hypothetical protein
MDAKVKELWVKALRSGEYRQGHGYLHNEDGEMCCLGVLCDVAVKQGIIPAPELTASYDVYAYDDNEDIHYLPESVRTWAGLDNMRPDIPWENGENGRRGLDSINDEGIHDFNGIASLIEKYL